MCNTSVSITYAFEKSLHRLTTATFHKKTLNTTCVPYKFLQFYFASVLEYLSVNVEIPEHNWIYCAPLGSWTSFGPSYTLFFHSTDGLYLAAGMGHSILSQ